MRGMTTGCLFAVIITSIGLMVTHTTDLIDFDAKGRALEGVLAVQVHVGPPMRVQYKDFKIKHLPDDLPLEKAGNHSIPSSAYGVRPQGRLPEGWEPPIYGDR